MSSDASPAPLKGPPASPFDDPDLVALALSERRRATCMVAGSPAEQRLAFRIRDEVFVREQGLFDSTDRDPHDDDPCTRHVLGLYGPVVAGTVRLYPLEEPGIWQGDRLAVLPEFRRSNIGGPLVRFAVRTASEAGGEMMLAEVQLDNVRFFEHLGWHRLGEPRDYVGVPHQQMAIDLTGRERR